MENRVNEINICRTRLDNEISTKYAKLKEAFDRKAERELKSHQAVYLKAAYEGETAERIVKYIQSAEKNITDKLISLEKLFGSKIIPSEDLFRKRLTSYIDQINSFNQTIDKSSVAEIYGIISSLDNMRYQEITTYYDIKNISEHVIANIADIESKIKTDISLISNNQIRASINEYSNILKIFKSRSQEFLSYAEARKNDNVRSIRVAISGAEESMKRINSRILDQEASNLIASASHLKSSLDFASTMKTKVEELSSNHSVSTYQSAIFVSPRYNALVEFKMFYMNWCAKNSISWTYTGCALGKSHYDRFDSIIRSSILPRVELQLQMFAYYEGTKVDSYIATTKKLITSQDYNRAFQLHDDILRRLETNDDK
ncbi:MAG: hypothetical protein ACOH5I_15120 [Oligoflexus sp.]